MELNQDIHARYEWSRWSEICPPSTTLDYLIDFNNSTYNHLFDLNTTCYNFFFQNEKKTSLNALTYPCISQDQLNIIMEALIGWLMPSIKSRIRIDKFVDYFTE